MSSKKENLAKTIAIETKLEGMAKVSTSGVETASSIEVSGNKKVSVNEQIKSCLSFPDIKDDPIFGASFLACGDNENAQKQIISAWKTLPNIAPLFNLSLSDIVEKCEGTFNLKSALALVESVAKEKGCAFVSFRYPSEKTDITELSSITVSSCGVSNVVSLVVTEYPETATIDQKVSCLASAFRVIRDASKGIRSIDELFTEYAKSILNLKNRGIELSDLTDKLNSMF